MTSIFSNKTLQKSMLFLLLIICIALIFKPNYPLVEGFDWVKNPLEGMFGGSDKEGLDDDDEDDDDSVNSYDSDDSSVEGFESEDESDEDDEDESLKSGDEFVKAMEQPNLSN